MSKYLNDMYLIDTQIDDIYGIFIKEDIWGGKLVLLNDNIKYKYVGYTLIWLERIRKW